MSESTIDTVPGLAARGVFGGVLMGLANLVPGISGGTMLLAAGIYPQFIRSISEVSTFRFRPRSVLLLGCVVGAAVVAIVALAGFLKEQVVDHPWVMYSLFIGLTLGGVPLLWRMVRPPTPTVVVASIAGILAMVALTLVQSGSAGGGAEDAQRRFVLLLVAGVAGGSAMILPGVSGAYLLMVLGQWVVILGAIDSASEAVGAGQWAQLAPALKVFVPVALGVVIGVVGVSHLIKLCLERFRQATLGVLLGFLLGAVVGLWPFQVLVRVANGAVERVGFFTPTLLEAGAALALVVGGFLASAVISRLGGNERAGSPDADGSGR